MKRILIICFNNLKNDARVIRQINFLKTDFNVTVVCYDAHPDDQVKYLFLEKNALTLSKKILLSFLMIGKFYKLAYKILYPAGAIKAQLQRQHFDLIIANDYETLPLAFDVANTAKVFFDAHEYAPRQFEDRLYWRVFFQAYVKWICGKYIPHVAGMSTINKGIADAYKKEFGRDSIIITNASAYVDNQPVARLTFPIRLVHHGIYTLSRQPNLMVDMMEELGTNFTLDLIYLIPPSASSKTRLAYQSLVKRIEKQPNIRILPALKSSEIIQHLHERYDIGIILVPPINFNYQNGLPNKLFDCIQSRIAMCVGPLPEIASIVNRYDIGIVSKDFTASSMSQALKGLTLNELNKFKANTAKAAVEMNAEFNREIMLTELKRILT